MSGHRQSDQHEADTLLVELRETIWVILEPTDTLCMELHSCLTNLENNIALTKRALREELNAMQMELISVREQVSQLSQSLYTISIQLRTLIK
ncbi:hypothetical protein CJ030_MR4G013689 [Morella rubra]|uniref:Uncharacterized protein n=1 Tax=Morella rubra TaxID=262757 RepID=A0A6A1WWM0_9ROSI|nr:hypothetical protein CJ030_MR4G013689 [Morella rubra]